MPGKVRVLTRGDLALYNGTDAASEVSWIIVPSIQNYECSGRILSNAMLNPHYIVGLVDGEGSFTVYIRNPILSKHVRRRAKAEPRFYVKLAEKDKDILYKLKDYFKCGNVYFQKDKRKNHQNCYRYEVANRNDLETVIIPFFKRYPLQLASKRKDFRIFCKIMKGIKQGKHLTKSGLVDLYQLKQTMH
jgi:hypothetical protein